MATLTIRPNADGNPNNWTAEPSGSKYGAVDEETPNGDTDYIYTNVYACVQNFGMEDSGLDAGTTINKITVYFVAKRTEVDTVQIRLLVNGEWGNAFVMTDDYEEYSQEFTTNPVDDEAWEVSDIDALVIGFNSMTDQKYKRITQVYVVVDYVSGVTQKSVAGSVVGSGSILTDKSLAIAGSVVGLGSLLRGKTFTVLGSGSGVGSVDAQSVVAQKQVSGLVQALGSILRGKTFTVLGSADGQAWIVVDKGEVYILGRVKKEDIYT